MRYTDPSGEEIVTAIIVGAIIAASTYMVTTSLSGMDFTWGGLATATFIGAVSGAATFGIGEAAKGMFTQWISCGGAQFARAAVQAVVHGTFQGSLAAIQGGNFWNGAAAGALSSIASSAFGWDGNTMDDTTLGFANGLRSSGAGMIAFGAVAGGVGASLSGGNFWQGEAIGLVVSSINYVTNKIKTNNYIDKQLKKAGYSRSDIIGMNDAELDLFGRTVFPEMYVAGGAPAFTVEVDLEDWAATEFDIFSNTVSIGVAPKSFSLNNFKLASLIGHELIHAGDYFMVDI